MKSIVFITREKFSRAEESLGSVLAQAGPEDLVLVTDIGYPAPVRAALERLLEGFPRTRWVQLAEYALPNAQLNLAIEHLEDDAPVIVTENDVMFEPEAAEAMLALLQSGEADVVSPLIMHGDTGYPHYDPPVSVILRDESDGSCVSFVERIPRNGWLPVSGLRTVHHIERHAFAATARLLRAIAPLNAELNTREQIEFSMRAFDCGARTLFEPAAVVAYFAPPPIEEMDKPLFAWRWDPERAEASNDYVEQTWNLRHFTRSSTFVARMNAVLEPGAS